MTAETLQLQPGETLVLFTDGVSEAFSPTQELFGEERLLAHLAKEPGRTAEETTRSVARRGAPPRRGREAVRRHHGGVGPLRSGA